MLQYVDSQEEFAQYHKYLDKYSWLQSFNLWKQNSRSLIFWTRLYAYLSAFKIHFEIPANFTFLKPGLEVKYACEEAENVGAKTYFLGPEFN